MAGNNDVYVFEDEGAFYVRPKVTMVANGAGKKVAVRNLTGCDVRVRFPNGPVTIGSCTIAPGAVRSLKLDPTADGIYEYSVSVVLQPGVTVPALAGSWPKIIVDP
jgi:hypothetical protein